MARTQAADYDERREAIVIAAAALFAKEGFNGAAVSDLAKRCKVSKALIYHYFSSKEDILYEVMISHVRALEAAAREAMAGAVAPERKLHELAHRFVALYVHAAHRHKVLLNELESVSKSRRAEIVAVQRGLIELVRSVLIAVNPALKRKSGESFAAAMLFFGMINWTHTWFDPKGPVSAAALAQMAADLTLRGLSGLADA
jgi:AcrR family transcriptional regulator